MRALPRSALAISLAALATSSAAHAAERERFTGFRSDVWRDDHGLPQNTVTDIVQDRDGFLWVSTFGGVVRFDGTTFDTIGFTTGLRSPRALDLSICPDEDVWVGLEGRGLQRIRDGRVAPMPATTRLATGLVESVLWADGHLWALRDRRLVRWDDEAWSAPIEAASIAVAAPTTGVLLAEDGTLRHLTEAGIEDVAHVDDRILSVRVHDGVVYFVGERGLYRVREGRAEHLVSTQASVAHFGAGPIFDLDDRLWFSVGGELYLLGSLASTLERVAAKGRAIVADETTTWSTDVRALFADRERNVWVGVAGNGLWRLSPQSFERIKAQHSDVPSATGVVAAGDDVVFGNQCHAYTRIAPDGTQRTAEVAGCIEALAYEPATDAVWVCADGLERHARSRESFALPREGERCTALLSRGAGHFIVGTDAGRLYDFAEGRFEPITVPLNGPVSSLASSPDGEIWIGEEDRVVVIADGNARVLGRADGVPQGEVRAIHFVHDRALVGTYGGGIGWIGGEAAHAFTTAEGLLDDFISFIASDASGDLWVSSNLGVLRVAYDQLEAVASGRQSMLRVRPIRVGETEGGASPSGLLRGSDLWIPTVDGLVVVRIDDVQNNDVAPVAVITSASLDGRPLGLGAHTRGEPGRGELRVRFRAAALREPNLRTFEYRLLGLADSWMRVDGRRQQAIFDGLAPGSYGFEVRAINEDRIVGPVDAFTFEVPPHFTQTLPFRGGLLIVFLGFVYGWSRWRTRRIDRQNLELSREIDSRLVAEAALRDREMHYRSVFRSSENGFLVVSEDGIVLDVNPAACAMFGYDVEELLDRPLANIVHVDPSSSDAQVQVCRKKDGGTFEARVQRSDYEFGGTSRTLVSIVDLSPIVVAQAEERRLREQLLRSQRVDAMGRLAGGIAHDINNMLTAVKCYADLALLSVKEAKLDAARADLMEISAGVMRTSTLTKKLLAFGRRESAQPRSVALDAIIRSLLPMLSRLTRDDIDITFETSTDVGPVYADPTHLEQILVNLVLNASQAMPTGGTIALSLDQLDDDDLAVRYPQRGLEGAHVRLSVEDEGTGMAEEVLDRVFEPFFSTKESQENTGLGLSVVHGIVTQAGGQIVVDSEVGRGSRFDVLLPAADRLSPMLEAMQMESPFEPGRGERLLYCDDDDDTRSATARILEQCGYDVLAAESPARALELVDEAGVVALLVTDVVMPKMNGRQLYEELRAKGTTTKVLYVSGYTRDALEGLGPTERFLPKPYEPNHLLREIRAILDEDAAA